MEWLYFGVFTLSYEPYRRGHFTNAFEDEYLLIQVHYPFPYVYDPHPYRPPHHHEVVAASSPSTILQHIPILLTAPSNLINTLHRCFHPSKH